MRNELGIATRLRRPARLGAIGVLVLMASLAFGPAQSTEGGVSLYVPGLRTTALGGTIGYNFLIGQVPVSTRIKVLREVETDNRFKGTIGLLTVSFPLGGQAPPAQPVTAKN